MVSNVGAVVKSAMLAHLGQETMSEGRGCTITQFGGAGDRGVLPWDAAGHRISLLRSWHQV